MVTETGSGGGFSLIGHPIAPRALAAPTHQDEYSFVLEGWVGVQVGEEGRVARPGDLVSEPPGIWHALWNGGDEPARVLEIISPAGFGRRFTEVAPRFPRGARAGLRASPSYRPAMA